MQRIKHLYWRAGFGLTAHEFQQRKNWTTNKAVQDLFEKAKNPPPIIIKSPLENIRPGMMDQAARAKLIKEQQKQRIQFNAEWIKKMSNTKSPLLERMSLFWHGHFACEPRLAFLGIKQLNTIQKHALGNFKDLVLAIAKDPAMIRYLNNQQNRKNSPNENFARELLELFTIGRGNYSENDIKEAARAFTGWSSDLKGNYVFRRFQHDYGQKTFFGKTGNFNGEEIIDIVLARPETAQFITRKIYKYFVNEKIDEDIVSRLSNQFYRSNYDIELLMKTIFSSNWFYHPKNIGTKIKSPADLIVGIMRQIQLKLSNNIELIRIQRALGQILFKPPNVAGWPGGKSWIDNSTLLLRLSIPGVIYGASDMAFQLKADLEKEERQQLKRLKATTNIQPIVEMVSSQNRNEVYADLVEFILQKPPKTSPQEVMKFVDPRNPQKLITTLCVRLMSLPEYQMC